jgi:predicted transcriptional regulator
VVPAIVRNIPGSVCEVGCDVYLYIMRRTQIYLDEQQTTRLDERAAGEGVTRSTVIRLAVDEYLARGQQDSAEWRLRWREAVAKTAGIASHLPSGAAYVEQLRAADVARLRELDR